MALDRKDIRAKLDVDMHVALKAIAESEGMDDGEWIESVLVPVIRRKLHAASLIVEKTLRAGITGNDRESPGISGSRDR